MINEVAVLILILKALIEVQKALFTQLATPQTSP